MARVLADAHFGIRQASGDQRRVGNSPAGVMATSPDKHAARHVAQPETPGSDVGSEPVIDQSRGSLASALPIGILIGRHPPILATGEQLPVPQDGILGVPPSRTGHVTAAESRHSTQCPNMQALAAANGAELPVRPGEASGNNPGKPVRKAGPTGYGVRRATRKPGNAEALDPQ